VESVPRERNSRNERKEEGDLKREEREKKVVVG
jgi:hypothetical protein